MNKIDLLRQLQADSLVLFMKLHNFHWNVKGGEFHAVHKATEEIYEALAGVFDDIAERIIQVGGTPVVTLKEVLSVSKIEEVTKSDFKCKEVLEAIQKDYTYLLGEFKKLGDICEESKDRVTQGYADSQVAYLEKAIWMSKATLA